jgi:hypothetical protein
LACAQAAEAQQAAARLADAQAEKGRLVAAFSEERQRWESDELARRGQLEERQAALVGGPQLPGEGAALPGPLAAAVQRRCALRC